jgi:hypothetical protein
MEKQAKRRKIQADPLTMLCNDVLCLIFLHISGSDFKKLFEVSRSWNLRLFRSPAAMKKIKLVFPNARGSNLNFITNLKDFVQTISKSERIYENIRFEIKNIVKWKKKLQLLKKFSSTIVYMEVDYKVSLTAKHDQNLSFIFPNLKTMKITEQVNSEFIGNLIVAAPKLRKLEITQLEDSFSISTQRSINKNTSIKELTLLYTDFESDFCPSSLTYFKYCGKLSEYPMFWADYEIMDYLENSLDTLTTLSLFEVGTDIVVFILTKLPSLKTLEFKDSFGYIQEIEDLENFCITTVRIKETLNSFKQQILKCLKNLLCFCCQENFSTVWFKRSSPTEQTWEKSI